ncbi:MAG TPA: hypothetical protein ENN68_09495 [Methanomicrobia archaeon]|nr:hypothetical protein [Methanomicrobia archaeon]
MKNKSLADVTETQTLVRILAVCVVLLVVVIALFAYMLWWSGPQNNEHVQRNGLEIVDIKITEPTPSLLNDKFAAIDLGESVTLTITVKNTGENITSGADYSVGIDVITTDGGKYWSVPPPQYVGIDLGPGGTSRHTFTATNKRELPFRGSFELQGCVRLLSTGEELSRSKAVTVEVRYPD